MSDEWFGAYDGQSTDELLSLEGTYRIDSLVAAFEEAIRQQAAARPLSSKERYVLAIEALERCDDRFSEHDEPIADRLFAWIKRHRASVRIGRAS